MEELTVTNTSLPLSGYKHYIFTVLYCIPSNISKSQNLQDSEFIRTRLFSDNLNTGTYCLQGKSINASWAYLLNTISVAGYWYQAHRCTKKSPLPSPPSSLSFPYQFIVITIIK